MKAKQRHDARRIGIFGASGSGKTTKAQEIIKGVKRLISFDALDNLAGRAFTSLPELQRFIVANYARGFRVRYVPRLASAVQELSDLSGFLLRLQEPYKAGRLSSQVTLFADELDVSFPLNISRSKPDNKFYYLCCRGRHYGVNIVGVSQRMSLVDLPFRANLSDLFIFRLADFNDLSTASAMLGKPYKSTLSSLPNYKFVYKSPDGKILT